MRSQAHAIALFDRAILKEAAKESLRKLSPSKVMRNPVMFVVEIGSILTTLVAVRDAIAPTPDSAALMVIVTTLAFGRPIVASNSFMSFTVPSERR